MLIDLNYDRSRTMSLLWQSFLNYLQEHNKINKILIIIIILFFQMQLVVVDGAHENGVESVKFNGVLKGLAPMCPPPNAVIAFPCHPGTIRKEQNRL